MSRLLKTAKFGIIELGIIEIQYNNKGFNQIRKGAGN